MVFCTEPATKVITELMPYMKKEASTADGQTNVCCIRKKGKNGDCGTSGDSDSAETKVETVLETQAGIEKVLKQMWRQPETEGEAVLGYKWLWQQCWDRGRDRS